MSIVVLSQADSTKMIASIAKRGANLDRDIHQVAVSAAVHYCDHGDITLANKLLAAMPKAARKNALLSWFLKYLPSAGMNTTKNKEEKASAPLVSVKGVERVFDKAVAEVNPFWDLKAQEGTAEWDCGAYIAGMLKRISDAAMKDGVTPEQKAKLEAAARALA